MTERYTLLAYGSLCLRKRDNRALPASGSTVKVQINSLLLCL